MYIQVCELDIIFNFEKAYFILDEFMLGGEVQETSKKSVLKAISVQDMTQEVRKQLPHPFCCSSLTILCPVQTLVSIQNGSPCKIVFIV